MINNKPNIELSHLESIILNNIPDFICIVKNQNNKIIYPTSFKELNKYNEIINNPTNVNGIYHITKTDEWFEKYSFTKKLNNEKILLEYYRSITRYKNAEIELQKDFITGISNRLYTISEIDEYIKYALDNNEEFTVIIADIDYFKRINDTYGHLFGDIVLKNIGNLINENLRSSNRRETDIGGRFGGDELFGLLKNISLEDTYAWRDRACKLVSDLVHVSIDGKTTLTGVSVSIGVHHVNKAYIKKLNSLNLSINEIRKLLYDKCDENLYEVKNRNHFNIDTKQSKVNINNEEL